MKTGEDLSTLLKQIDRKGYKAYKGIKSTYDFGKYALIIDHVQGDPFALPSRIRVRVSQETAGFPPETYQGKSRETGLRDFLSRAFFRSARRLAKGNRGTGKSGLITIDKPGQEILVRSSVHVSAEFVEARFVMGLPATGRTIAGKEADEMFLRELPRIVNASLMFANLDKHSLFTQIQTAEDADVLRGRLGPLGLVAFVADGSILPRASGIDLRPLTGEKVVPFTSPESLRQEIVLPNRGRITGMGIRKGITLIVGGGYHGKSTLLKAIEAGVYNHVPGDGREMVVTDPKAVKIRAEDGRRIEKVNISTFISNLPFGQDTEEFSTDDASGSTSQAANIIESLEVGAQVILLDEDTSATNFMIRDHRMQELISKEKEPITPFIDRVAQLLNEHAVSTILVMGGSGDYFDVADCVIGMDAYRAVELTAEAREIAARHRAERHAEGGAYSGAIAGRVPLRSSFDASRGKREVKISPRGLQSISFGIFEIDLGAVEQLVDISQTRAIGDAIHYATWYMDGKRTLREVIGIVMNDLRHTGLDALSPFPVGDYAAFREFELAAAINRLRTLLVTRPKP